MPRYNGTVKNAKILAMIVSREAERIIAMNENTLNFTSKLSLNQMKRYFFGKVVIP